MMLELQRLLTTSTKNDTLAGRILEDFRYTVTEGGKTRIRARTFAAFLQGRGGAEFGPFYALNQELKHFFIDRW